MTDKKREIVIIRANQTSHLLENQVGFLIPDMERVILVNEEHLAEIMEHVSDDIEQRPCEEKDIEQLARIFESSEMARYENAFVFDRREPLSDPIEPTRIKIAKLHEEKMQDNYADILELPQKSPSNKFRHNNSFAGRPVPKHNRQNWKFNRRIMK